MATHTFERRTGWCGIAFVVLAATSGALAVSTGGSGDTVQEVTSYYADETKQLLLIVSAVLMELGIVFLLPFVAGVRALLRRGEETPGPSAVAYAGGIAFAGLLALLSLIVSAVPAAAGFIDDYTVDKTVAQTFEVASWWGLTYVSAAASVFIGAAALGTLRSQVLPGWLAIAGLVTAFLGLLGLFLWGAQFVLQVLWLLVVAVRMARGARVVERAARGAALGSV